MYSNLPSIFLKSCIDSYEALHASICSPTPFLSFSLQFIKFIVIAETTSTHTTPSPPAFLI